MVHCFYDASTLNLPCHQILSFFFYIKGHNSAIPPIVRIVPCRYKLFHNYLLPIFIQDLRNDQSISTCESSHQYHLILTVYTKDKSVALKSKFPVDRLGKTQVHIITIIPHAHAMSRKLSRYSDNSINNRMSNAMTNVTITNISNKTLYT